MRALFITGVEGIGDDLYEYYAQGDAVGEAELNQSYDEVPRSELAALCPSMPSQVSLSIDLPTTLQTNVNYGQHPPASSGLPETRCTS